MKRLILILFTMIICTSAFAQESEKENRNVVYLTIGSFLNVNISYERIIWKPDFNLLNEVSLRGNIGYFSFISGYAEGFYSSGTVQVLSAGEILRWDFGAGLTIKPAYYIYPSKLVLVANAGMRVYSKSNPLILRFGVGYPELLYISFGYAF